MPHTFYTHTHAMFGGANEPHTVPGFEDLTPKADKTWVSSTVSAKNSELKNEIAIVCDGLRNDIDKLDQSTADIDARMKTKAEQSEVDQVKADILEGIKGLARNFQDGSELGTSLGRIISEGLTSLAKEAEKAHAIVANETTSCQEARKQWQKNTRECIQQLDQVRGQLLSDLEVQSQKFQNDAHRLMEKADFVHEAVAQFGSVNKLLEKLGTLENQVSQQESQAKDHAETALTAKTAAEGEVQKATDVLASVKRRLDEQQQSIDRLGKYLMAASAVSFISLVVTVLLFFRK